MAKRTSEFSKYWDFGEIIFLNHGSFGACPKPVREQQYSLKELLEKEPVDFLTRKFPSLIEEAHHILAEFIGARGEDFVFVPNATYGVNTVLKSFPFREWDEIICRPYLFRLRQRFVSRCFRKKDQGGDGKDSLSSPNQGRSGRSYSLCSLLEDPPGFN